MIDFDRLIASSANPEMAARRLEHMREDAALRHEIDALSEDIATDFIHIIGYSRFFISLYVSAPASASSAGFAVLPCKSAARPCGGVCAVTSV